MTPTEEFVVFTFGHPPGASVRRLRHSPEVGLETVALFMPVEGRNAPDDACAFITAITESGLYMPYMPRSAKLIRRALRKVASVAFFHRTRLTLFGTRFRWRQQRYRFWTAIAQFCNSLLDPQAYL